MHFLYGDLQTGGQIHKVALGSLLGSNSLAEQLALPVYLADGYEGYDEGREKAEAEGEEEGGHREEALKAPLESGRLEGGRLEAVVKKVRRVRRLQSA